MDFKANAELIETTFAFMGLNPIETRGAEDGQWVIYNGDTEIYIDLWELDKDNAWLYFETDEPVFAFQTISPVCLMPLDNLEQFYEEILHNNLNMLYASYTINKEQNMLAVRHRRPAKGLTQDEIIEAIESVGYYSESTFKALKDRYLVTKIGSEE
ncbi:MAG: YbjN domain-containing protein [Bacteroidia bacterium]|nr:YbjN domain-containing protein [Bacteroidia bacterium]